MKDFPTVPLLVLEGLSEAFPDKLPRHLCDASPATQLAVLIGQQQVIDFLRSKYTRQNPST